MTDEIIKKTGYAYVIRVKNHLEPRWVSYFEGWTIENLKNGEVLLRNPDVDQAGLHGALTRIRDLNLTLLSVNRIINDCAKK